METPSVPLRNPGVGGACTAMEYQSSVFGIAQKVSVTQTIVALRTGLAKISVLDSVYPRIFHVIIFSTGHPTLGQVEWPGVLRYLLVLTRQSSCRGVRQSFSDSVPGFHLAGRGNAL